MNMYGEMNRNYRHGGKTINKPEYNSWRSMRERCNYPKHQKYKNYGGRGIKVCDRWNNPQTGFINFLGDMGKKPTPKHSIDRINTDGDYEPNNCRWADQKTQVLNSSVPRFITINGVTDTLSAQIKRFGACSMALVYKRFKEGWGVHDAILTPDSGRAAYHKRKHDAYLAKIKDCVACGKKCKFTSTKYCSLACYHKTRDNSGRFTTTIQ